MSIQSNQSMVGRGLSEARVVCRKPARLATVAMSAKQSPSEVDHSIQTNNEQPLRKLVHDVRNVLLSTAGAVLLGYSAPSSAEAEQLRLAISRSEEVMQVQESMLESWSIIDDVFFDTSTLNRINWPQQLVRGMLRASSSEDASAAYDAVSSMLSTLGDPYTRIIPPSAYNTYQSASEGELQGVGLLLASDPRSNHVVVAAPIANSPAERAGLRRGDIVVAIDGKEVDADTNVAGELLRGKSGTQVSLSFVRFTGGYTPGVAARAPMLRSSTPPPSPRTPQDAPDSSLGGAPLTNVSWPPASTSAPSGSGLQTVTLQRAPVRISAVVSGRLPMRGQPIGYIRLSQFNSTAPQDVQEAVTRLSREGVRGFILDLRDNPGGLVGAGLDIANIWLPGGTPAFAIAGRDGVTQRTVVVPEGPAQTDLPLVVLVNDGSASASEILAGALHDSGRARIIGDSSTYGKGRIQAVFEMGDGAGLFVTVASYQTPHLDEIDHTGISPDLKCTAPTARISSEADVPISVRAIGVWEGEPLEELLFSDSCVMTAGKSLAAQATRPASVPRIPTLPAFLADTGAAKR
eukprot:jgi/Ulvmu1/3743/UM173_0016.1